MVLALPSTTPPTHTTADMEHEQRYKSAITITKPPGQHSHGVRLYKSGGGLAAPLCALRAHCEAEADTVMQRTCCVSACQRHTDPVTVDGTCTHGQKTACAQRHAQAQNGCAASTSTRGLRTDPNDSRLRPHPQARTQRISRCLPGSAGASCAEPCLRQPCMQRLLKLDFPATLRLEGGM